MPRHRHVYQLNRLSHDKYFDSSGVRIRYVEAGTGTPIVLVHGFTRNIETNWIETGVLSALAKRHRVIAVDLRGHGKSGKPHDPKAYEADVHLDVIKLIDHLQIPRAHLVGYSAGCSVVGRLAVTHPERVISIVLGAGTILRGVWEASDDENAKAAAADLQNDPPFRNLIVRLTPKDESPRSEEAIKALSSQLTGGNDLTALMAYRTAGGRARCRATRKSQLSECQCSRLSVIRTQPLLPSEAFRGSIQPSTS